MSDRPGEVLRLPAFALFWSSSTLGAFTGAVSAVAFQVLIVTGRLNASIRTVNRIMFLIGALIAGGLATAFGFRVTIGVSVVIFVIAALIVLLSPLRTARHEDL